MRVIIVGLALLVGVPAAAEAAINCRGVQARINQLERDVARLEKIKDGVRAQNDRMCGKDGDPLRYWTECMALNQQAIRLMNETGIMVDEASELRRSCQKQPPVDLRVGQ